VRVFDQMWFSTIRTLVVEIHSNYFGYAEATKLDPTSSANMVRIPESLAIRDSWHMV